MPVDHHSNDEKSMGFPIPQVFELEYYEIVRLGIAYGRAARQQRGDVLHLSLIKRRSANARLGMLRSVGNLDRDRRRSAAITELIRE
jgi:hypothetical protein